MADCLSRDHPIPSETLTQLLHLFCPEQMPQNFRICQVPQEIKSWVYTTLRLSTKPPLDPQEQMQSTIGAGLAGKDFSNLSSSAMTRSWIQSQPGYDQASLSALLRRFGTVSLPEEIRRIWQEKQSERPWTKWQRSSLPSTDPILSRRPATD